MKTILTILSLISAPALACDVTRECVQLTESFDAFYRTQLDQWRSGQMTESEMPRYTRSWVRMNDANLRAVLSQTQQAKENVTKMVKEFGDMSPALPPSQVKLQVERIEAAVDKANRLLNFVHMDLGNRQVLNPNNIPTDMKYARDLALETKSVGYPDIIKAFGSDQAAAERKMARLVEQSKQIEYATVDYVTELKNGPANTARLNNARAEEIQLKVLKFAPKPTAAEIVTRFGTGVPKAIGAIK